ncbi:hypothetical protein C8R45DRAFT_938467 [Mycena sanguinolenta]|nr:hypothetical protein C8R45DRAFT_938467 [Mycena sanguinolenta]
MVNLPWAEPGRSAPVASDPEEQDNILTADKVRVETKGAKGLTTRYTYAEWIYAQCVSFKLGRSGVESMTVTIRRTSRVKTAVEAGIVCWRGKKSRAKAEGIRKKARESCRDDRKHGFSWSSELAKCNGAHMNWKSVVTAGGDVDVSRKLSEPSDWLEGLPSRPDRTSESNTMIQYNQTAIHDHVTSHPTVKQQTEPSVVRTGRWEDVNLEIELTSEEI